MKETQEETQNGAALSPQDLQEPKRLRYFMDTEFVEDGKTIDLVSIGIVCEDGREFYAESSDADLSRADEWVRANVVAHLWHRQTDKRAFNAWMRDGGRGGLMSRGMIAGEALRFCDPATYGVPEFWGYYGDYDWVAFCQLFGRMLDLPKGYPMYLRDLKQLADERGVNLSEAVPQQDEHHALADARWNRDAYAHLSALPALLSLAEEGQRLKDAFDELWEWQRGVDQHRSRDECPAVDAYLRERNP